MVNNLLNAFIFNITMLLPLALICFSYKNDFEFRKIFVLFYLSEIILMLFFGDFVGMIFAITAIIILMISNRPKEK